ncbi:hypothetical protein [Candidatus Pseudoruminococcus sp.]
MNYRLADRLFLDTQKLAVSKGSHLRQRLWSPFADDETLYAPQSAEG